VLGAVRAIFGGVIGSAAGLVIGLIGGLAFALLAPWLARHPAAARPAGAAVLPGTLVLAWSVIAILRTDTAKSLLVERGTRATFGVLSAIGAIAGAVVGPRVLHGKRSAPPAAGDDPKGGEGCRLAPVTSTKAKLLDATIETLRTHGIAGISARTIAATAGVNQALVFYHFGSVDQLLAAACTTATAERVAVFRDRFAEVGSLRELLAVGGRCTPPSARRERRRPRPAAGRRPD
jgi:hypothetical protein